MAERKYYVRCESGCLFEGMTKEQTFAAIAEATGNTPTDVDKAFITKLLEQNTNAAMRLWLGTEAEYNALEASGAINTDTIYYIKTGDVAKIRTPIRGIDYFTEADKQEIIDRCVNTVLLWENASSGSEFPAQEIELNLSQYDRLFIEFNKKLPINGNPSAYHTVLITREADYSGYDDIYWDRRDDEYKKQEIKNRAQYNTFGIPYKSSDGGAGFVCRDIATCSYSIKFSDCAASNNYVVPMKIYAIKGVI